MVLFVSVNSEDQQGLCPNIFCYISGMQKENCSVCVSKFLQYCRMLAAVLFSLLKICMLCFCSRFSPLHLFLLLGINAFGTLLK